MSEAGKRQMTLGMIVGNRGFFPDHLARSGHQEMRAALESAGVKVLALTEAESKFGAVETRQEARRCADLFKDHREAIDGIVVTLPNFGDERAIARTPSTARGHPHFAVEGPLTKIDVEAQAEFWMASGVICGFGGGRPTHHQAGAGHDAVLMGFDDAAVHAAALAEIISVHDEKLGRHLVPHKARAPCKGAGSLAGEREPPEYCSK